MDNRKKISLSLFITLLIIDFSHSADVSILYFFYDFCLFFYISDLF